MSELINKKWVYLPCEIEYRDVYHRTLLGVALAHKDASYVSFWLIKALRDPIRALPLDRQVFLFAKTGISKYLCFLSKGPSSRPIG